MSSMSRREFTKGLIGLALLGAGLAAYWPVIDNIVRPKYIRVSPDPQAGANVKYVFSSCLGCNVRCGIKVRVVDYNGVEVVEKIEGNPYHPYNRAVALDNRNMRLSALPYKTPVSEALTRWHGTLCARGQDGIHYLYDPYRVLKPLKRAGPRGSGKWKVISWDQLVKEVVEGGFIEETGEKLPGLKDFYVYGKLRDAGFEDPNKILSDMKKDVDNILAIAKNEKTTYEDLVKTIEEFKSKWSKILGEKGLKLEDILIDPSMPDLGTKANMVVYMRGRGQPNTDQLSARWIRSIGSVNWLRHTSSCQLAFYTGNKLWEGYYDLNVDVIGAKVIIAAGISLGRFHPGATGQGVLIERAAEGQLKLYYVNPHAPRVQARGNIIWVPVKPGEDGALAMAIARILIENKWYDEKFLKAPNDSAAKELGYPIYTNATWLVIFEEDHARFGEFLKAKDVGLEDSDKPVVSIGGELNVFDKVKVADLDVDMRITLKTGETIRVKTAFSIYKDEVFSRSLEEWLEIASPYSKDTREFKEYVELVKQMAKDFAEAAPQAGTCIFRGIAMHPNGDYTTWTYRMLDTLIANFHRKGGILGRPSVTSFLRYIYELGISPVEPVRWGPPIDRHSVAYEDSLEYWLRVKRGESPYPTKRPWYPHSPEESYTELFAGIAEGYPYRVGALILFYANPVIATNYGVKFIEVLKDTTKIPLFIGITTTINESYIYADYIVPDTTYLETGTSGVQFLLSSGAGVVRAETWRSPAIMPLTEYIGNCPYGHPRYASFWEFFIDVGKELRMPGYGENAIPGVKGRKHEGKLFPLHCYWEYILMSFANAALHAKDLKIIPESIPADEIEFVNRNYPIAKFRDILPPDEWPYVAYGLARGGVFTSYEESFDTKGISKRSVPGDRILRFWYDKLAKTRNNVTGEKFWGGPRYLPPATYAPVPGVKLEGEKIKGLHGIPLKTLYKDYTFRLYFSTGPLLTKHRSTFYYWIRQVIPENYAIIHPDDARKLGIETGDVIRVITPTGSIEVPVVVEPTTIPGTIHIPYGLGRWADTIVSKPKYFNLNDESLKRIIEELPEKVEIPEDAVNPVRGLPEFVKKILFTKSPREYYERGLAIDEWRFNGVTPNVVEMPDPSLGGWPMQSWLGAGQAYFSNPAKIEKTGKKHKFKTAFIVW
ncbi:MAG: molybdopterin dinucleotide binding domain-containing protein [Acidilobaceae archaeon]